MNTLNGYSKSTLTDKYVLTAAGGHLAVGNANKNIPLNNGTVNTNLNADLLDGKHASSFYEKTAADGKFILFSKVSKSTVEGTNNAPHLFNIENENLITGYKSYWYVFNMGAYSGGNYRTQMAMPYLDSLTDSELFIRSSDKAGSWRAWRRVLHSNNYTEYTVKKDGTGASGTWGISISGTAANATSAAALACNSFDTASQITTAYAQWTNHSGCSDIPSMGYAAVLNVGYGNYRWWQIWNSRNNHQLFWRPEKSDASGWADVHTLIDDKNISSYLPVVTNYYWANVPISATSNDKTTPTFANTVINGTLNINSGNTRQVLTMNSTNSNGPIIKIQQDGTDKAWYGYSPTLKGIYWYNANDTGIFLSDTNLVGIGTAYTNAKLHVNGSTRIQYNTPWLYIKDTNTATNTYSILSFGNSSNDNAAYVFLNGPSRTEDGGANKMTIRNNVGSLRLNNDTEVTGLLTTSYNNTHKGIKIGNSYINAIDKDIIFQNNNAIRFGGDNWDWNVWAGLKYTSSSKTIHLGLADGTIFQANNNQSGGTLNLPGISHITSSYYRIATGHITQHTHTTTGGWYRVAKLKSYFNFDIHVNGKWSTGMPSVIKVNVCQINGTAKITQLAGYVGSIGSQIRLGKVATDEWDVLFYSPGFSSGTMAQQNFVFFGIGNITTYTTNTISTTSYTSTTDLAFTTITGISLTTDNYTTYLDSRYYTKTQLDDRYVNTAGDTMTGTLTMYTTGTGSYNHGIRINRVKTSDWALILIGKSGTKTEGTGTSTAGDGAWLIGTPASSNSLIFNLNDASESKGLCLKGHGASDMKWNNNTVWHAGNDGSGSGLDADLLDGYHESSFLRYRNLGSNGGATLWSQIGIRSYHGALPEGLSGIYNYGEVVSLPGNGSRLDIFTNHVGSSESGGLGGLWWRSGWNDEKRPWRRIIDSGNIANLSVNYANSAGNADTVDNKHASDFATSGHNHDASYVKYAKVSKSTADSTNAKPYIYNIESETVISGYYGYWYILNLGLYSGGNFGTLLAMPYQDSLTDSELFIRSAKSGSWRTWRRVLHDGNSSVSKSGQTLTVTINGSSQSLTNSTYNFSGTSFTSGNLNTAEHNANNITSNGHWYYTSNGPSTSIGATTADGALYSLAYSSSWVGQIAQDYRDGDLFTRGKKDGTWTAWKQVAYALDFIKKSGDTLSSGAAQIQRAGSSVSWYLGRSNAMLRINSYSGYNAIASMKTTNGDWSLGVYANNVLYFTYITDTNFNANTNTTTAQVYINASGNVYATHFYEHSDINLKTNIKSIITSDNIPQLKSFDWKSDGSHSYGLIAQELEELGYSELVSNEGGLKTVKYSAALSLIVGKLQVKIKELEKEIENLKNKN